IEWNLDKIASHGLGPREVEHAFRSRFGPHQERDDGSFETVGPAPAGRPILVVWRYDEKFDALEEPCVQEVISVITAY
ncbi:MAG: hypothetical protein ACYTAF_05610, partial [Planctomycetota bacterium]